MNGSPLSPPRVRGGFVLLDPTSLAVRAVLPFQYNPETLTRTLAPQWGDGHADGDALEALRLKGPPVETLRVEADIDAAEWLDCPDKPGVNDVVARYGLLPQLASWEGIASPTVAQLRRTQADAAQGVIEVVPDQPMLTLLVWSSSRIVPIRLTEFSVAEEAFDTALQPIRAKVTLAVQVLSTNDLGFTQPASALYLQYQQRKETLAGFTPAATLAALGLNAIPSPT